MAQSSSPLKRNGTCYKSGIAGCPSGSQSPTEGDPPAALSHQIPTEGNPPAVLAPQRSASSKTYPVRFNGLCL
ncbi:hypothetical protein [Brasilonema sennae]|uniref:hypothetical protein n=1 Tax=Brasilonema sennae TaxID=1397703 RepID=UPI0030D842C6